MAPAGHDGSRVATSRLIEAAAGLDPAARALLNLWLHRGLSDAQLAAMAKIPAGTVTARKLDIVEHLSTELGLPPYEIVAALGGITRSRAPAQAVEHAFVELPPLPPVRLPGASRPLDRAPVAAAPVAAAPLAEASADRPRADPPPPDAPPADASAPEPTVPAAPSSPTGAHPSARRFRFGAMAAVLLIVAFGVTLAVLAGSGSGRGAEVAARSTGRRGVLRPLSGGRSAVRGDVTLVSAGGHAAIALAVAGLPVVRTGHYEAWLYTTIIDSRALGAVPEDGRRVTLELPPDAASFRWIDVSLQPSGYAHDSGESVLRAPNPARSSSR